MENENQREEQNGFRVSVINAHYTNLVEKLMAVKKKEE